MRVLELKVGNWIKDGIAIEKITIDHLYCLNSGRCEYDPIQLTEEWLLKFGFVKYKYGHNTYRQKSFIIEEGLLNYEFRKRISKEDSLGLAYVKYVHQLQNLYFALTGEELTFKSE